MQLQDIIIAAQFKISEGSEYQWACYGQNARFLDFQSEFEDVRAGCIFDSQNQTVYEAYLYFGEKAYRWLNPEFSEVMYDESFERDIDPRLYLDEFHFSDCEVSEDLIEKITDAFETGTCTNDIIIPLNLTPEQEELFARLPEHTDLNEFITQALMEKVEEIKAENQENWDVLSEALKQKGIKVTVDESMAPLPTEQIALLQEEIENSGLTTVELHYSNKLTKDGLIFSLASEAFNFKYKVAPRS
jgi:ribonucleotide reductase alpha subunit